MGRAEYHIWNLGQWWYWSQFNFVADALLRKPAGFVARARFVWLYRPCLVQIQLQHQFHDVAKSVHLKLWLQRLFLHVQQAQQCRQYLDVQRHTCFFIKRRNRHRCLFWSWTNQHGLANRGCRLHWCDELGYKRCYQSILKHATCQSIFWHAYYSENISLSRRLQWRCVANSWHTGNPSANYNLQLYANAILQHDLQRGSKFLENKCNLEFWPILDLPGLGSVWVQGSWLWRHAISWASGGQVGQKWRLRWQSVLQVPPLAIRALPKSEQAPENHFLQPGSLEHWEPVSKS